MDDEVEQTAWVRMRCVPDGGDRWKVGSAVGEANAGEGEVAGEGMMQCKWIARFSVGTEEMCQ